MELGGEEKKIRASFHELRLEDERITPRFATVWNRAHSSSVRRQTAIDFRVAATVVIVCLAVFSLALLSKYWQRNPRSNDAVTNGFVKPGVNPAQIKKDRELVQQGGRVQVPRPRLVRFARRSQTAKLALRRSITRDAIALSRWQSPTTNLLRSPGDEVLKALPQVNRTLRELESFLPNLSN